MIGGQAERYRPELIDEDPFGDDLDVEGADLELFQPDPPPEWEESGSWWPAPPLDEERMDWDPEGYDAPEPYGEAFDIYSDIGGGPGPFETVGPDTGKTPGVRPRRNAAGKGHLPGGGPTYEAGANPEPGSWNGSMARHGGGHTWSWSGAAQFIGTATATAALSAVLPEEGGREIRNMPVYIARTRRGFRVVRAGGKLARSGAQAAARAASRIGAAVSKLAQKAVSSGLVKALVAHAALPAALLLLGLLPMVVLVTSPFATKSSSEDLNDTWLYVTRLDAVQEQSIQATNRRDMEIRYFVNGVEAVPGDIHVCTDIDYLLSYLDTAHETANLSDPISGFFGGSTVQEEVDAIHGLLYSCAVQDIFVRTEMRPSGPVVISRREVSVSMQSLQELLASTSAVSDEMAEIMESTAQVGRYAALEALGNPFGKPYYVRDRWGWYLDADRNLRQREAVELVPEAGNRNVFACLSGTVEAAAGNSITVSSIQGPKIIYTGLSSIAVAVGQQVERGERLGAVPYYNGSLWLECRVGDSTVNPMFYLPRPS